MVKKLLYFSIFIVASLSFAISLQSRSSTAASVITLAPTPTLIPPSSFEDLPQFIKDYLNAGNRPIKLNQLLRSWQFISDTVGGVEIRKGSTNKLVTVHVSTPNPDFGSIQSIMIFAMNEEGKVQDIFIPYNSPTDPGVSFKLLSEVTVNFNDLPDMAYIDTDCGAHTCTDNLNVIEWNGQKFVDLIDGDLRLPHPTYLIELGQITAVSGYVNSVGAGPQRAYTEIWKWNGKVITVTDKILGPPIARMHLVNDADAKLEQGDTSEAISNYKQAIEDQSLPSQFLNPNTDYKQEVVKAYATFKLFVAYTVLGQIGEAQKYLEQLVVNHSQDTEGNLFVILGQVFWDNYSQTNNAILACEAVVSKAKANPKITFELENG